MSKQFFQTLLEKYKNPTGDNFDGERPSFIKFIYPSKFLTTNNKLTVRLLPRGEELCWWIETYIHRFKVGKLTKLATCMNSLDDNGKVFGKCKFCQMLKEHSKELSKEDHKILSPKLNFLALVYHYSGKTIYKLSLSEYDIANIVQKMDSDLSDSERDTALADGFNIIFTLNEKGYPAITEVKMPKHVIEETEVLKDLEIPNLMEITKPSKKILELIDSTYDVAVKTFLGNVESDEDEANDEYPVTEDVIETSDEDDQKETVSKEIIYKNKTKEESSDEEDDDDQYLGIKDLKGAAPITSVPPAIPIEDEDNNEAEEESAFSKMKKAMAEKAKGANK